MVKKIGMIIGATLAAAHCLIGGAAFADSYTQDGKPCPPECVSDSMEIVTWYPSPYNEYEELRLYPKRSAEESQCNSFEQLGLMYYNQDQQALKVCRQDPQDLSYSWKEIALGGGYWQLSGNDIFNTNSGYVGIGTQNPEGVLHVKGKGSSTHAQVYIESFFGGLPYLFLKDGNSGTSDVIQNNLGDLQFRRCTSAGCTGVAGQDDTWMTIKSSGKVGIGTTAPKSEIQIGPEPFQGQPNFGSLNMFANRGGRTYGHNIYFNPADLTYRRVTGSFYPTWIEMDSYNRGDIVFHTLGPGAADSIIAGAELGGAPKMTIKNNGSVGIGTTDPQGKLDIHTADYLQNFRWIVDSGSGGVDNGAYVRLRSTDGYGVLELGSSSDAGVLIHTTGGWRWTGQLNIMGDIGIGGVNAGSYKCYINGTGYLNAAAWAYGSDLRLKENISYIQSGLNVVEHLKPVKFDYIKGDKKQAGFIAQEVREVLPDIVTEGVDGMLGVKTDLIIPYLVKAIQEQQKEIEVLKEKLNAEEKVDQGGGI